MTNFRCPSPPVPTAEAGLGDVPVPADYDRDGRADVAVYRAATGEWFVLRSSHEELVYGSWGAPSSIALGDVPVPGDYDADGRADLAVYRQTSGQWFILNSSNGSPITWQWGGPSLGDVPVAARY